jgi:hypothetical protein
MSSKYYRAYGESSAWLGMVKEPRLLAHHILVYFAITAKLPMAVGRHLFVDASRTFLLHLCLVRDILQNEPTIDEQKILLLRVLDLVHCNKSSIETSDSFIATTLFRLPQIF